MRATADTWKWFRAYKTRAIAANDRQRMQLVRYHEEGIVHRYDDPQRALHLFAQGVDLARKLSEPCWELFHNYWICDIYIYSLHDINTGMEKCIRNFTLAHQPSYQNCEMIGSVYRILLDTFYMIDSEGYIEKIRGMIDYMYENVRLDRGNIIQLQWHRAGLHCTLDEWDEAETEALKYLDIARGSTHFETSAYALLMTIALRTKNYEQTQAYAIELETNARKGKITYSISYALLAQAFYKQYIGQQTEAETLYRQAMTMADAQKVPNNNYFFDMACAYQERNGDFATALQIRDQQLSSLVGNRMYDHEVDCRIERCRLLGRMGKPLQEEIEAAYEATKKLKTPDRYLEKLRKIEAGDYFDVYSICP